MWPGNGFSPHKNVPWMPPDKCSGGSPLARSCREDIILVMEINEPASDFELRDLQNRLHRLSDLRGRIVVVNFWSCECPQSERTDDLLRELTSDDGTSPVLLSIASNRNESRQAILSVARTRGLPTVLLDPEHEVADLYGAQTTPHVFVIDAQGILRYRGAVDDVTFRQRSPSRFYVREALEALRNGGRPPTTETLAHGCSIVRHALE
jgi:peroxiredoxin